MDQATEQTLSTGWLARLQPELRREFLRLARPKQIAHGAPVYRFQEEQTCLWGIASGHVRLHVAMNEQLPRLAHVGGPGFWFGSAPVILGTGRMLQADAFGETRLFAIERSAIVSIAARYPDAWQAMAGLCVMNELIAIGAGEDLMIRQARRRLIAVLLRLAGWRNAFQGTAPFDIAPITQHELADASCLSRSSAASILKELAGRGLIRTDYGSITILDGKTLAAHLSS